MKRVHKLGVSVENLICEHSLVRSMVSYTVRHGKKRLAVRLINRAFEDFFERCEVSDGDRHLVLDRMVETLRVKVSFFKRRIGSRTFFVPYVLTPDRSFKHSVKRLYKLIRKNQRRDYPSSLSQELVLLSRLSSRSLMIREKNRIYAEAKLGRALYQVISKFKLRDPERLRVDPKVIEPIECSDD